MIRALMLVAVLGLAACHKDEPPPPKPPSDTPIAAPVSPVTKEPISPVGK